MQQQMEKLLTSQEAISVFTKAGLSEPTFRRRIQSGYIVPASKNRGGAKYPRTQVYAAAGISLSGEDDPVTVVKARHKNKKSKEEYQYSQVRLANRDDVLGIALLVAGMFGGLPNPDRWLSWIEKNPHIAYVGIVNEEVISCGFVVPHREKKILNILSQEITPPTRLEEILEYRAGEHVCLYARTICVAENDAASNPYSHVQRRIWATGLLLAMTRGVIDLGYRGVIIDKMYGRSDSKDGERAMRTLGCTEIKTSTSHRNFMIDFSSSGLNMVLRYEKAYLEYQRNLAGE